MYNSRIIYLLLMCLCGMNYARAETVREALERESYTDGIWTMEYPNFVFIWPKEEDDKPLPNIGERNIPPYYDRWQLDESSKDVIMVPARKTRAFMFGSDRKDAEIISIDEPAPSPRHDENTKNIFASLYKVHLMPKPNDFAKIADMLARKITQEKNFRELIAKMKIAQHNLPVGEKNFKEVEDPSVFFDMYGNAIPFIVLYARPGKAQELVHHLHETFREYEGIQLKDFPESAYEQLKAYGMRMGQQFNDDSYISPRFNIAAKTRDESQTSSIIYYAQGNGDYKAAVTINPFEATGRLYKRLLTNLANYRNIVVREDGTITVPGYANLFDPATNGALLYPDYFDDQRDFHLYLPDSGATKPNAL